MKTQAAEISHWASAFRRDNAVTAGISRLYYPWYKDKQEEVFKKEKPLTTNSRVIC